MVRTTPLSVRRKNRTPLSDSGVRLALISNASLTIATTRVAITHDAAFGLMARRPVSSLLDVHELFSPGHIAFRQGVGMGQLGGAQVRGAVGDLALGAQAVVGGLDRCEVR